MLTIAGGLAFGLGGKEAAKRYIEHIENEYSGGLSGKEKHQNEYKKRHPHNKSEHNKEV